LKIHGKGYLKFVPKSLGGSRLSEKMPGGNPYFGFYCIFINKYFEICLRGASIYPPPSPLTPLCASMPVLETASYYDGSISFTVPNYTWKQLKVITLGQI